MAVVFSILNFLLGWLIRALLFVPALLTLGLLFLFLPLIVNVVVLWLTDKALASFEITTVRALWLSAAVITLVNFVFYTPLFQTAWIDDDRGQPAYHHARLGPAALDLMPAALDRARMAIRARGRR